MAHFIEKVKQKDSDRIWLIIVPKDSDRMKDLAPENTNCLCIKLTINTYD